MCRLQAALAGAQAARRELEQAHAAAAANVQPSGAVAAEGEVRALGARLAEAEARAKVLARQLETERAHAAAVAAALKEEVQGLKVRF